MLADIVSRAIQHLVFTMFLADGRAYFDWAAASFDGEKVL